LNTSSSLVVVGVVEQALKVLVLVVAVLVVIGPIQDLPLLLELLIQLQLVLEAMVVQLA
jgi:hypothetical protein